MNKQHGFGAIAAIVILVILAALSSAIVSLSTTQHMTSAQDMQSAKAWQAASAGSEYGLFRALSSTTPADVWKMCSGVSTTLNLSADTGFYVTVFCDSWGYNEGQNADLTVRSVRVYRIRSIACPVAAGCTGTNSAAGIGYVERARTVFATN